MHAWVTIPFTPVKHSYLFSPSLLPMFFFSSSVNCSSGGQTRTGGLWVMSPASETISSTPLYLILMKDSNLRLPAQRDPTYHLSNEKTVTHFHRQITNAYQTLIVLEILAGTSLSYPGFVFGTGFEPVPLPWKGSVLTTSLTEHNPSGDCWSCRPSRGWYWLYECL